MGSLSFAFFYIVLASARLLMNVRALTVEEYSSNETFTVLLLDSADSSYKSSSPALRQWVDDALRTASEGWRYQLQLISIDTQVLLYKSRIRVFLTTCNCT